VIETQNSSGSKQSCFKGAFTTGKKLAVRLLLALCVFTICGEICSRCFWRLQGLSFFGCHKQIHLLFYPELKHIEALSIPQDDEYYDILLLGGSVLHEDFSSVDRLLGIRLENEKGKKVRIHNVAFRAHSSLDSYYKYRHLRDKQFDFVIVYQGINEVRANNCPPSLFREDYSHYSWYSAINLYEKPSGSRLLVFPYTLTLTWIRTLEWLGLTKYVPTNEPNMDWINYGSTIRTREPFKRNLIAILELAQAKREPIVLMSFSYYIPEEYPNVADWWMPVELWGKPEYVAKGIAVHNAVIEELAQSYVHVMFVDQNKLIPKERKYFRDTCHFTDQGSECFVDNYLLARYRQATEMESNDAHAHYELANTLFRLERYGDAVSHYHQSLEIQHDYADTYIGLGRVIAAQGSLEQAITWFRQALRIQPSIGDSSTTLGRLLQLLHALDEILSSCNHEVDIAPNPADIHLDLGAALFLLAENDRAVRTLRQKAADDPDTHHNLEMATRLGATLETAICYLHQARESNPDEAKIYYSMGSAIVLQGRFEKLISWCHHLLQAEPDDTESSCVLNIALKLQDTVNKVINRYRQIIHAEPGNAEIQGDTSEVFESHDALVEAINHFREALLLQSNEPEAHCHLGQALESKGEHEEAITQYQEALKLRPSYAQAHYRLGNLMSQQARFDIAVSHYYRALKVMTRNADLHFKLGEAFRSQGQFQEPISHYRQALQIRADHGEARYNLDVVLKLKRGLAEVP
jgi:tetratricopeptide (TPR) repeat protein